jgi:hypothetical protein
MSKQRYNSIIEEVYQNYVNETMFRSNPEWLKQIPIWDLKTGEKSMGGRQYCKDEFIDKCKTDQDFSERWGLKIIEDYDLVPQTECWGDVTITKPVRRYKTYIVYKNKVYQFYE